VSHRLMRLVTTPLSTPRRWSALPGGFLLLLCLLAAGPLHAWTSGPQQHPHIEVELLAEAEAVAPGTSLTLALRLRPQEGWHSYWRNPGDSGMETRIHWTLPAGVEAGPIQWPTPQRYPLGPLVNYGFAGDTWLLVELRLAEELAPTAPLAIEAKAEWLVCEVECIPGEAVLALALPVAEQTRPALGLAEGFAAARQRLPVPLDPPARFAVQGRDLVIEWPARGAIPDPDDYLFLERDDLVDHGAPQRLTAQAGVWQVRHPLGPLYAGPPEVLHGVLRQGGRGLALTALPDPQGLSAAQPAAPAAPGLALVLLSALLGGLLLNLMPCVFPVLSLKALSLAQGAARGGGCRPCTASAIPSGCC
jgi:DsbC/DsbD-like thiol-disulfide interchange protein